MRPLLRRRLLTDGVVELTRTAAHRDTSAIVAHSLKLGDTVFGFAAGLLLPRDGERFLSGPD